MEQLAQLQAKFDENVLDATNAWSRHVTQETRDRRAYRSRSSSGARAARAGAAARRLALHPRCADLPGRDDGRRERDAAPRVLSGLGHARFGRRARTPAAGTTPQVMEQILDAAARGRAYSSDFRTTPSTRSPPHGASVDEVRAFLRAARAAEPARRAARVRRSWSLRRAASSTHGTSGSTPSGCKRSACSSRRKSCARTSRCRACSPACSRWPSGCSACASSSARGAPVWHPDVRFFDIETRDGARRRQLLPRPYARAEQAQRRVDGRMRRPQAPRRPAAALPVAYLVCNFLPPVGAQPALLTHDDVVTLFHEFGHGLHHMLTRVDYPSIAGINGVAWDAVELPSQFMENYAWHPEVLPRISAHVETGAPLPQTSCRRSCSPRAASMPGCRRCGSSSSRCSISACTREYDPAQRRPRARRCSREVRARSRGRAACRSGTASRNSFGHIFAGGYAAGYYSYKWAEVLAADAFARVRGDAACSTTPPRSASWTRSSSAAAAATRWRRSSSSAAAEPEIEPLLKQLAGRLGRCWLTSRRVPSSPSRSRCLDSTFRNPFCSSPMKIISSPLESVATVLAPSPARRTASHCRSSARSCRLR